MAVSDEGDEASAPSSRPSVAPDLNILLNRFALHMARHGPPELRNGSGNGSSKNGARNSDSPARDGNGGGPVNGRNGSGRGFSLLTTSGHGKTSTHSPSALMAKRQHLPVAGNGADDNSDDDLDRDARQPDQNGVGWVPDQGNKKQEDGTTTGNRRGEQAAPVRNRALRTKLLGKGAGGRRQMGLGSATSRKRIMVDPAAGSESDDDAGRSALGRSKRRRMKEDVAENNEGEMRRDTTAKKKVQHKEGTQARLLLDRADQDATTATTTHDDSKLGTGGEGDGILGEQPAHADGPRGLGKDEGGGHERQVRRRPKGRKKRSGGEEEEQK